jgi:hypothetical protein
VANLHRMGQFGNHVEPPLMDVVDAIRRHASLEAALGRWPRCPQYWSFEEGHDRVRYCVFEEGLTQETTRKTPSCAP